MEPQAYLPHSQNFVPEFFSAPFLYSTRVICIGCHIFRFVLMVLLPLVKEDTIFLFLELQIKYKSVGLC